MLKHLAGLRSSPESLSDDHESDRIGRRVDISFIAGFAVHYWIDFPDQHIKLLAIEAVG